MIRSLTLFCLGVLLLSGCATERWRASRLDQISTPESKVFFVNRYRVNDDLLVEKFRLTNGLKIIVMRDQQAPVFAYQTWFNVGSIHEREGITGMAHFFEHLMFKGTKNYPDGYFDRIVEENGGALNASTYTDWTYYRESLPVEAFSIIPPLEADRLVNLVLNEESVNAEREVVKNERRLRTDNSPDGAMFESLYANAFKVHPYRWPVIGWMKDIENTKIPDFEAFYQTFYAPNNATVVVVGDLKTERVLKEINLAYGSLKPSLLPKDEFPAEPKQEKEINVTLYKPISAPKILLGYKIPNASHEDYRPLEILNAILFDGASSRMYRRLVTEEALVTNLSGWVGQQKDPALWVMGYSMRKGKELKEAEASFEKEILRIQSELVTEAEINRALNRFETYFWKLFDTGTYKARAIGFYETLYGDYRILFDEMPKYRRITPKDVQRVAKEYLNPKLRTRVYAFPEKTQDKGKKP